MLGAGGFGITYLAFDHKLDGPVALKEYFPTGIVARSDDRRVVASSTENHETFAWGLERFIEEARAVHRFRHLNVVRVHRFVEAHGTAYIVMEYIEGESLAACLKSCSSLSAEQWWPWLDRLLHALMHVHGHGYLHRDIKPGNIVLRAADGEPVLIDFGSARVAARDRTHTRVLTPEYAPIEQHSSRATQGPPTDIYALAAVSYRALTGAPPPEAPDRILDDRYEPLVGRIVGVPHAWLAAIDEGLALKPQDRPQTVAAWRDALHTARARPASSRPNGRTPNEREREILDFLNEFIEQHGYAPSLEEIGRRFGLSSLATQLANLQEKGFIRLTGNHSRPVELVPTRVGARALDLPLLGTVAAGVPIEAVVSSETVGVPEDLVGQRDAYALRVHGNSMIDEQIRDGDIVIVEDRKTARNGEMVIALLNGNEVTLKKFYLVGRRLRLQPANPGVEPLVVDADQVQIQGVVVGVLRRY